jgi:hypothetical protein
MKCRQCREHPAVSVAAGICSSCLYLNEMGAEAHARQVEAVKAEARRKKKLPAPQPQRRP